MILNLEAFTFASQAASPGVGQWAILTANLVGSPGGSYSVTAYATLAGSTQVEGHFFTAPNPTPNVTPWVPATGTLPSSGTASVVLYSGPVAVSSDYAGYNASAGLDLHVEVNGVDTTVPSAIFLPAISSSSSGSGATVGTGPPPATPLPTTTIAYSWQGGGLASVDVSGPVNQLGAGTYTGNPPDDPVSVAAQVGLEAGTSYSGFRPAVTGTARAYLAAVWAAGVVAGGVSRFGGGQPGTVTTFTIDSAGDLLGIGGANPQATIQSLSMAGHGLGSGGWSGLVGSLMEVDQSGAPGAVAPNGPVPQDLRG